MNTSHVLPILLVMAQGGPTTTEFWHLYSFEPNEAETHPAVPNSFSLRAKVLSQLFAYIRGGLLYRAGQVDGPPDASFLNDLPAAPVYLGFRRKGSYLTEGVGWENTLAESLNRALERAVSLRKAAAQANNKTPFPSDLHATLRIQVSFLYNVTSLPQRRFASLKPVFQRGLHGLGFQSEGRLSLFGPSKAIVHNYTYQQLFERLSESAGFPPTAYRKDSTKLYRFDALSFLQMDAKAPIVALVRDDEWIPHDSLDTDTLTAFRDRMADWLLRMLEPDGRMQYKYIPSRGTYSTANNMIRQWMATLALAELYRATGRQTFADSWRKNADYNLANYYIEEREYAHILFQDKSKLGALALALMALALGPTPAPYHHKIERLQRGLEQLRQDDGSYRTFLLPPHRNDNQSFYPGEALLARVTTHGHPPSPTVLSQLAESRDYYMAYHRSTDRNTAFVPWHTMAYHHAYGFTRDERYRTAVYEMNDWLIQIQELRADSPPDVHGRFFLEEFAHYGPAHASSTAIYVEGLAYAYDFARQDEDSARADAYLHAIRHGLRSLMQLEFRSINSYYLFRPKRVLGGLRTRVNDNQLRIDNTQHAIMAVLAVQRFLTPDDYTRKLPGAESFRTLARAQFDTPS